ncbi:S8 family serine peptidase [Rudanella paleaurantiibacter]|uniref:S8 family serine peptidase n=1 Tax=Rudanella paleaurantiibacter TaxID=2614655 RepID=A0A7J5TS52_9BACT|nr:S8 family serine peptidase [Rudanella paleaurantiibacter]KAB7725956.1 S8 family serine peptidase [Rudanella paleaurantiibacter]
MRLIFTCFCLLPVLGFGQIADSSYARGQIYIKLRDNITIHDAGKSETLNKRGELSFIQALLGNKSASKIEKPFYTPNSERLQRIYKIEFLLPEQVQEVISKLLQDPAVEYAERVPVDRKVYVPNDYTPPNGYFVGQYNLEIINAIRAWDITRGSGAIVVAVTDDGVATSHVDLAANLVAGRDVVYDDNDPNPDRSDDDHGTHVAGIVSATTDNNRGIASLGFSIKVMPVKIADNQGRLIQAYKGVRWAADNGARVINMSWGSPTFSQSNQDVINYAASRGCVLVASAGNDAASSFNYPAAYDNVISVASTDIADVRSFFSNFGSWIDIAAPGSAILSTLLNNTYGLIGGTSMASPLVASLAGLMLSVNPTMNRTQVEAGIKATADNINAQNPNYIGQLGAGRINAFNAVNWAATVYSTASGSWTGSNWTYQAPSQHTNPVIQAGHTVTVPSGTYPVRNTLNINGTLDLSTTSSVLNINNN